VLSKQGVRDFMGDEIRQRALALDVHAVPAHQAIAFDGAGSEKYIRGEPAVRDAAGAEALQAEQREAPRAVADVDVMSGMRLVER
jgi:hypothetical protein